MRKKADKKSKKIIAIFIILIILIIAIIGIVFLKNEKKENVNSERNSGAVENEEYKVISKYNSNVNDSQDVKIRINKMVRGDEAENILEKYNKNSDFPIDFQKGDDEDILFVEYEINFMNFDMDDIGTNKDVFAKICQNEKEYIEYNSKIYSPIAECINNDEFTKDRKTKGNFVIAVPKGCTDYKIKIGENGKNVAYFDGI